MGLENGTTGMLLYHGLTPCSWVRAACTLMGAALRGAMRSHNFKVAVRSTSLNLGEDKLSFGPDVPPVRKLGDVLSSMAIQLANIVNVHKTDNGELNLNRVYLPIFKNVCHYLHGEAYRLAADEGLAETHREAAVLKA